MSLHLNRLMREGFNPYYQRYKASVQRNGYRVIINCKVTVNILADTAGYNVCMYLYVCMRKFMFLSIVLCVCMYVSLCMYVSMYASFYFPMHECMLFMHVYVRIYVGMCVCMYISPLSSYKKSSVKKFICHLCSASLQSHKGTEHER